jgi:16S rRNA (cytosine1402-N4)-methyltransferase
MTGYHHEPVLVPQLVGAIAPADGEIYVDCTVGGGGHAEALLRAARCVVLGLDRDPAALAAATSRLSWAEDRFRPVHARFSALGDVLDRELGPQGRVHGIVADLGVSSHQLDTAERGFSFRQAGPLDMRMDPTTGNSAEVLVNTWDETSLTEVIRELGEERHARRVAQQIVAKRPFRDTATLAAAIAEVVPHSGRIHSATRTFQALRIAVNDELTELDRLLSQVVDRLHPGGRLAVITFHSLEDRRVKRFLEAQAGKGRPKDPYGNPVGAVHLQLRKDVAGEDPNPRARSARLRSAVRLPWNAA